MSVTSEVAALKLQVKVVFVKVNSLKVQLKNREITLEEFKTKKEVLENQLRDILGQISKYKEKGTVETKRDAIFAEEANRLMYEFQTEFSEMISKPTVFISASLEDHFTIDIDFSNYPERPTVTFPNMLHKLFSVPIDTKFDILNNWDPQNPRHMTEIFYEIERLLLNIFKSDEIEETNLNQVRIQKILQRRKFLESAQYEMELKNIQNAVDLYQRVVKLSYELEDFEKAKKYAEKIAELKDKWNIKGPQNPSP